MLVINHSFNLILPIKLTKKILVSNTKVLDAQTKGALFKFVDKLITPLLL